MSLDSFYETKKAPNLKILCVSVVAMCTHDVHCIEQAQARSSGIKTSDALPPPMMHVVELPARFNKHKKTTKR